MNIRNPSLTVTLSAWALLAITAAAPAQSLAAEAAASGTTKINIDKNYIKPTPAQNNAIRRAVGKRVLSGCDPTQQGCYSVAPADFNDDGHPDLLVVYSYATGNCGSAGCSGAIVMATAHGYAGDAIGLPNFYGEVDILADKHHHMHDLRFNGDSPVWKFDGRQYQISR